MKGEKMVDSTTNRLRRPSVRLSGVAERLWYEGDWKSHQKSQKICDLVEIGAKIDSLGITLGNIDVINENGLFQILNSFYQKGTSKKAKEHMVRTLLSILNSDGVIFNLDEIDDQELDSSYAVNEKTVEQTKEPEEELVISELPVMTFS
jgi:hypothetical protein